MLGVLLCLSLGAAAPAGSYPPSSACGRLFLHEKIPQVDTVPSVKGSGTGPRLDLARCTLTSMLGWSLPATSQSSLSFKQSFCREGEQPEPHRLHLPERWWEVVSPALRSMALQ